MDCLKSMRWTLFTTGAILILLGIFSLLRPAASLISLAFFIGIAFIASGINHLVPYFTMKGDPLRPAWLLPEGILDILLGVILLAKIGVTAFMIPILLGAWVMFMGIIRLIAAFKLRAAGLKKWWLMLVSGAMLVLWSFAMISSPLLGALMVTYMIGSMFIFAGLLVIAEGKMIYAPGEQ